ncbi:MAG: DNRLRE domain-containing protein, partial [Deltaproteobacteria bacterium]|nr:DNRLRE domain-containing protein [Deltaproteobacteria bacterium]
RATLLVSEGGGGSETENVRLESVYPMTITILLHHGYIVWSPLGKDHQGAAAVKSALAENGRASQILEDLSVYEDLNALDGIFAVLGVFGNKHQLTSSEGETLKADLDNGGRLYLEGGDVWFADPKTAVHDYFQIEAVSDGTVKTSENMKGYNFLYGYDYGYSLSGIVNAFIDNIKAKSGTGSRLILRNEGVRKTGSVVAYQGVGYRTIGSSVVFAGIEAKDGGQTKKALMGKYIYFLENGFPPCGSGAQCEDFDVCTADVCSDAICGNDQILGCVPCDDDSACGVAQACNPSLGYCVDVPGEIFASTDVPKSFGSMAPIVQSHYTVTSFGNINKIYLKAGIVHTYRGDVEIKLSHAGKTVVLKKNSLFDSGDDIYETYDVIQPGESLEQFKNTNIAGKWTLTVEDKDPLLNNGILKNWTLFADYDESTCAHLECDGDGVCSQKVNPGWCFIAETCHTEGTGDPSNQCRVCDTGVSQTSWSPRSNGTSCDDGMWCTVNDLCDNGVCSGLTKDCSDGISCTADACDEIQDECESSLSEGWCYISNGCYADNAANPSNQCQICDSQASFSSWTNKSDGSACNDGVQCTSNDICVSGSCGGVSYQCQPATCEETSECDGSGGCVVTYKPGGTICDDGNPCTYNDVCGSSGSSTLSASADSWIWQAAPGTNYGADTQMLVYPWTGASAMRRSLLKFDFSSIPSGSSVNSAVITLCEAGTYGFTRTIGFYRALKNWTEGGVTWNKSDGSGSWTATGGDFAATPTATASVSWTGVLDCDTWDVTADIQAFVAGSLPNYGWVIKDANEDNSQNWWSFATKENASASQRPKLTVSYTKGGGCSGVSYSCVPTACQETSECDGSGGCDVVYKAQGTNCGSNMECDGGGNCVELTKILYVNSVSGNNMTAQIGNPLKPWKTVQGAINSVPSVLDAAYIVEITNSATYNETVTITAKTTTAKNTLTVRAQSGQSPLIVGQNTYSAAVTLQTVNYVTLKGLRTKGGDRRNAIRLIDGSNYNTIEGCEAFGTTNQGYSAIDIKKSANNIVTGCSIYGSQNGISVYDYGAADNVIKNNLIYNNTYRGVWIYRVTYGNVVANNTIYNNATGIHLGHGNNNYDPGINNIFVNNIIYAGIASSYAIKV